VKCWFDEDDMKTGNVLEKMASGIDDSKGFWAFITDEYRNKVNGDNKFDNCKYEFNYACLVRRNKMLAAVLEPEMKDPKTWRGTLGVALGNNVYTDLCDMADLEDGDLDSLVRTKLMPRLRSLGIL
jgi:hypothetical protein